MQRRRFWIPCFCLALCLAPSAVESSTPLKRPPASKLGLATQAASYFAFPPSGPGSLLARIGGFPSEVGSGRASAIQTAVVDLRSSPVQYASFEEPGPVAVGEAGADMLATESLRTSSESRHAIVRRLEGDFSDAERVDRVGPNFHASTEFTEGLVVHGKNVALKLGGYLKGDLIYDFDAIDSTDTFDTTTIAVGAPERTNARFHARQSRLNFDTRWGTDWGPTRGFVEADFFGEEDTTRLRHAYGEVRQLIVGQTWTTLAHRAAIPRTLDSEGAVSSISRRQAQVRWTEEVLIDGLDLSVALEDPRIVIESPEALPGSAREPTADLMARVRLSRDWGELQCAGVFRELAFQPVGQPVATENAWGVNFTGEIEVTEWSKFYHQVLFGRGIGSYKGLPDITLLPPNDYAVLDIFGWMIGWTVDWHEKWTSNFTYSVNRLDNAVFQDSDELHENTYMAMNLIWNPAERFYLGGEYLFGTRENVDGARGEANRIQVSFIFVLP